jgi:hypothetical protein
LQIDDTLMVGSKQLVGETFKADIVVLGIIAEKKEI